MIDFLDYFGGSRAGSVVILLLACGLPAGLVDANPLGGTVSQGNASFSSQGSQFTIQTSANAMINWQSFNIGLGQTTTFVQPSSSSVVWNQINDPNPSQILGTLNANGYVVLQNQAGFYIGGQAVLNTHGLTLTTSPTPAPDLTSGGAWQFNAPPPTASIINYGQVNIGNGGSAYLIAHAIENHGTISAPQGQIGLYAGQQVLLSDRPDGRGLSATVTLPSGSVDNSGRLIADAGTIAMHAQVVNQGGLVQANSVRNVNGVIELVASDAVNLGANSILSAQGDSQGISPGGKVAIKSGNTFSDQPTSAINISGGARGGNGGELEISAANLGPIQSTISARAVSGFLGGKLTLDPYDLTLDAAFVDSLTPILNAGLYEISLQADHNITLSTVWTLADPGAAALLTLTAGNNITLNDGSAIIAGNNWGVSLSAGPQGLTSRPANGRDGIYLNGDSYIQTQNGSINLWAANEVIVNPGPMYPRGSGDVGNNGIRTLDGGNISVTAQLGDVNTGGNYFGYDFSQPSSTAPYYTVMPNLGGISTYAGGNVTITAGRNVTSYLPTQSDYIDAQYDGGSGAFGAAPGDVTVTAGGKISGHYVVANGVGTITAGGDVGAVSGLGGFALSLVKGSWNVYAPNGSIYVQDIRNPNGVFNDAGGSVTASAGYHRFDYDPSASVLLQAGNLVEITGSDAPHLLSDGVSFVPIMFPPSLRVVAGAGGFELNTDVTLFPSPQGELNIVTTGGGNFQSVQEPDTATVERTLAMSGSAASQWDPSSSGFGTFGINDNSSSPAEFGNPNPVQLSISGSMQNIRLRTTKATQVTVAGDAINFDFLGLNLHPDDTTSINVTGNISYSPTYAFTTLSGPITSANTHLSTSWDAIFSLLVDPNADLQVRPDLINLTPQQLTTWAFANLRLSLNPGHQLAPGYDPTANPGFVYDPASHSLGFRYQMPSTVYDALDSSTIPILSLDPSGHVQIVQHADGNYYFATTTASFAPLSSLDNLYTQSQASANGQAHNLYNTGFQIGGPGQFNINAPSIDLGSSLGIVSWGMSSYAKSPIDYGFLTTLTKSGAAVNVTSSGDISLLTSAIASVQGGDVTVNSGGSINLSQGNFALIPAASDMSYGIFTSGPSDVKVTAQDNINVGGARIAAFDGGNVTVTSEHGNVNAGNGANSILVVPIVYQDPSGQMVTGDIVDPRPFGSGIMAISPSDRYQVAGSPGLPGDITVSTPEGDIVSTLGGIGQFALNGSIAAGPTITLTAGTPGGHPGNVNLGQGGVIGGTINITAEGSISGLIVSRQDANVQAVQSFSGTLLSGGTANVSATAGSVSGTIIGIGGVNASGGAGVTAAVLGQNVSIGGAAAASTLGATAATTSSSAAAAQQASADTTKQLATDTTQEDDSKKKPIKAPTLTRRVGRVTVILPKA